MSRAKEEKKRKRDEEAAAETVTKKPKKSKSTETSNAPALEQPVAEPPVEMEKKEKKDKKDKKSKKAKVAREEAAAAAPEEALIDAKKEKKKSKKSKPPKDGSPVEADLIEEMKISENFIGVNDDEASSEAEDKSSEKKKKKSEKAEKKSKKEKKSKPAEAAANADESVMKGTTVTEDISTEANGVEADSKAAKKEKKKKKKSKDEKKEKKEKKAASEQHNDDEPAPRANDEEATEDDGGIAVNPERNQGRFIVFVGNLPYTATKEQIEEHFAKIKPTDIRMRTYKGTQKFMGTCFLEFDRFDRMETCLKKYHHSLFPDGKKKSDGRKINVELSAGGGGNSEARKSKILAKNEKLNEERAREFAKRMELENKRGERKEKKESRQKKTDGQTEEVANEEAAEPEPEPDHSAIHPARLAMMSRPATTFTHRKRF